ncbi:hypothetical protein HMPREF1591_04549, partial [Escherichia coli 113303]
RDCPAERRGTGGSAGAGTADGVALSGGGSLFTFIADVAAVA